MQFASEERACTSYWPAVVVGSISVGWIRFACPMARWSAVLYYALCLGKMTGLPNKAMVARAHHHELHGSSCGDFFHRSLLSFHAIISREKLTAYFRRWPASKAKRVHEEVSTASSAPSKPL